MTEKTKKYLAVGSGAIICVALIAAIALQFGKSSSGEDKKVYLCPIVESKSVF